MQEYSYDEQSSEPQQQATELNQQCLLHGGMYCGAKVGCKQVFSSVAGSWAAVYLLTLNGCWPSDIQPLNQPLYYICSYLSEAGSLQITSK